MRWPIWVLVLFRKVLNDMGTDEMLESSLAHMQDSHTTITLAAFGFPNCPFPDMFILAARSSVNYLDPPEK